MAGSFANELLMVSSVLTLSKEFVPNVSKKEMVSKGISGENTLRRPTFNHGSFDEMEVFRFSSEYLKKRQVYGTRGYYRYFSSRDSLREECRAVCQQCLRRRCLCFA